MAVTMGIRVRPFVADTDQRGADRAKGPQVREEPRQADPAHRSQKRINNHESLPACSGKGENSAGAEFFRGGRGE